MKFTALALKLNEGYTMKLIAAKCATMMFNSVRDYIEDNYDPNTSDDDQKVIIKADQFLAPEGADKIVKGWFYNDAIKALKRFPNLVFEIDEQEAELNVSCQNAQTIDEFIELLNSAYRNRVFVGKKEIDQWDDKTALLMIANQLAWWNNLCPAKGPNSMREWLYDFAKSQWGTVKTLCDKGFELPLDCQTTIIIG